MKSTIILSASALVLVAMAGAAWFWRAMTGPLYHPGDVRAGEAITSTADWRVAPNIVLHHFEEGSGTPILIVHGGPGFPPARPWSGGSLLAREYRLIYYHQRGCGLSSRPIQRFNGSSMYANMRLLHETLGLPAQIADIERIRRILGVERLILLGHSFGADIAALYAAEFPEHVRALVFVAPADLAVLPASKEANLFETVRRPLPVAMQSEYDRYLAEYFDFRRAFQRTEAESSAFYGHFAKFYGAAAGVAPPQNGDAQAAGYVPLAVFCSMGQHHDYTDAFRAVRAPVLVIHGARDLQPESVSRHFATYFAGSRFVAVESAGHFLFEDRPAEFAAEIRKFLRAL